MQITHRLTDFVYALFPEIEKGKSFSGNQILIIWVSLTEWSMHSLYLILRMN